MKIRQVNSLLARQLLTFRNLLIAGSLLSFVITFTIVILQLQHPEKAQAAICDVSYTLDWSDPSTYNVTCGTINATNWSVKGKECLFTSPNIYAGGTAGDPDKEITFAVRVNQSGNLDGNDTAWVYMKVNGVLKRTFIVPGDSVTKVFAVTQFIPIPADGYGTIEIRLKNDKTNELWQIKSNDVTACVRTLIPLPIHLSEFTANSTTNDNIVIDWTTSAEVNNEYFSLERSANGNIFKEIHKEEGAGNSNSIIKYSYTDENPYSNINFYRLRQVDYDGQSTLSKVVKVNLAKKGKSKSQISIYPNPAVHRVNIAFYSESNSTINIMLSSQTGKIIANEVYQSVEGDNIFPLQLPSYIIPGSYYIKATSQKELIGSELLIVKSNIISK